MNSRFLPMGDRARARRCPAGRWRARPRARPWSTRRSCWPSDGEGGFDRGLLFGSTAVQYVGWVAGTVAGVLGGAGARRPERSASTRSIPAFFLALLIGELRSGGRAAWRRRWAG